MVEAFDGAVLVGAASNDDLWETLAELGIDAREEDLVLEDVDAEE